MNTSLVAFVGVKGPALRRGAGRLVMATRTQGTVRGSRRINGTFFGGSGGGSGCHDDNGDGDSSYE